MGTGMNARTPTSAEWGEATKLVRAGLLRSEHGETSEALYLNSGFVYEDAETAAARFVGEDDGYVYARYGNPTITMFEERLRALEGAEACYATASGMAAVYGALACQVKTGDHIVASRALFGSCHQIVAGILPRFGGNIATGGRHGSRRLARGDRSRHQMCVPGNTVQSRA